MHTTHRFIGSSTREVWIIAAVVTQSLFAFSKSVALPTEGVIAAGQASITTPSATSMQIGQESKHAIINWNSFGIGKGEALIITQPTNQSTLLNRVLSNNPSSIFGTLQANGRVFLVNPHGMIFAPGASINVGGLVASTLPINDTDFLSEKYSFLRTGATTASLTNQGLLNGGFVALLGNDISNSGTIVTTKGSAGLAAGNGVLLDLDSSGLVAIKIEQKDYNARISNSGVIESREGAVLMSASTANELLGSVVNNSGVIRATSMTEKNGQIVIEGGTFINTGSLTAIDISANVNNFLDSGTVKTDDIASNGIIRIKATGNIEQTQTSQIFANGVNGGTISLEAGESLYLSGGVQAGGTVEQGGKITLTAPRTTIAGAQIEATGKSGGGTILIGGGWQGNDTALANAAITSVTNGSMITANALDNGNGGTIVVWSDQSTAFAGSIEAKGGAISGNGGKVEVSGHDNLAMVGEVTTTAPKGENGLLLLDPRNITIDANASTQLFSVIPLLDPNPTAGDQHGSGNIVELRNGNIVVASPLDDFVATDAGAVRLYKPDGTLLSTLTGSTANDQVGEKVIALSGNNNAVTLSRNWSNTGVAGSGAATWIDGSTGISGNVSMSNSFVGSSLNDAALASLIPLANGNYVLASPGWDNGTALDAGAVTWGNGTTGGAGVISALNSLVGSTANDGLTSKITALTNGNYVISSSLWDKGGISNVGAVTWGDGLGGTIGVISGANSLIGSKSGDNVGIVITALTNGNYVIGSPNWDNGTTVTNAGAATWVNGSTGAAGTINATNSLVGPMPNDKVGTAITALSNGNYIVNSPTWDNGATVDAGATTWGNGTSGTSGTVNAANSLIGSTTSDALSSTVMTLSNGNYVVASPNWDNGLLVNAGAVTWGDGVNGTVGIINNLNSLVGSTANDGISYTMAPLTNGNYVVGSPHWDNGTALDVGAVTWGNGAGGTTGAISAANSLVGSTANDGIVYNITALTNGNYIVGSPNWDNSTLIDAGAVTWGNGVTGTVGTIGAANSLVGSTKNDFAGSDNTFVNKITALKNGNYIVASSAWDRGAVTNAGAVTWGDGLVGAIGEINITNSLVGSRIGDQTGSLTIALPNGNYVVGSSSWDNGTLTNAGAVTLGNGVAGTVGAVSTANSMTGTQKDEFMSSSGITPLTAGSMNGSFVVSSMNASTNTGGVIIVRPQVAEASVQQEYSANPGVDNTFTPAQITALLNTGNNVILKANNNITLNSAIVANNPFGNGGNLDMNAGQSLLLNANIVTDNGNLTLIANDKLVNGVVDAMRSTGNAVITMAAGTSIDTGTGNLNIELRDGAGLTNQESGDITLCSISAGTMSAINYGRTAGSGITLAGALTASASNGNSIILAGQDFNNNTGSTLSTAGSARWLIYSDNPGATSKGGLTSAFRHYSSDYSSYTPTVVSESGNGFIYASIPGQVSVNTTLASGKASSYYGDQPNATFGYALSGFADNEENAQNIGLSGAMTVTGTPTTTSNTGTYPITYSGGLSCATGFTFIPGTALLYTVDPQPLNIIADPQDKTYGSGDPTFTWSADSPSNGRGLIPGDLFTGELSRAPGEDVNQYAILQNTLDNSNYAINYTGAYLTINQRPITLNATTASTVYGEADPVLAVSITGGSLGKTSINDSLGDVTGFLSRQAGSNVGSYNINLGTGIKAANYAITFEQNNNAFSVDPRPLNISANPLTKTYGDADPALTWSAETHSSGRGLLPGDNVNGELSRSVGENARSYTIGQNTLDNSNYAITYTGADLTINPRPITLLATSASKIYGELDPALAVTVSGGGLGSVTVNDVLSDVTGTLGRQEGSTVGNYDLTLGTGSKTDNYAITFSSDNNALSITPRPVNISADPQGKTYGDADPTLTWTTESQSSGRGLITGDSFNGSLTRAPGENVRGENYAITQNTLDNSNYAITYTGDYLTIQPRSITLNSTAATKTYGEPDPSLAVTITQGSLGNTTVTDALSDVTGILSRQSGSTPGSYDITLGSGSKSGNYNITYTADNNDFSITKRPINITANALSKTYGDADPLLTLQAERPAAPSQSMAQGSNVPVTGNLAALNSGGQLPPSGSQSGLNQPGITSGFIAANPIVVPEPAGMFFAVPLPVEMFTHNNPEAVISLELGTVNGSSIPNWMSFDPVQKIISGTPPAGATGDYQVEMIARDQFGGEIRTTVLLKVG